ncbi:peptidase MA family metallohydrolase [Chloroflexota bacterium]
MSRKLFLLILLFCSLLALGLPGLVRAESNPRVTGSSVQVDYPGNICFTITAESGTNITDIRLHYQVNRMTIAAVTSEVYLDFSPAPRVETQWDWDMRKSGGLPPGTMVKYWWTVTDASDNQVKTEPAVFVVRDERYQWRELTEKSVTLFWYQGGTDFADDLMHATQQVLARVEDFTGAVPEQPISIYVYASAQDLRGSMIFPQEWTGGVAFTRYSTVAIGISPDSLEWGKRAIAHELTHLVIHQITFSAYGNLPTWLEEGLAMYAEGDLEGVFLQALYQAVIDEKLITVRSMASPFSAYAGESVLAYAESYSVASFLVDAYGKEEMFELLKTFKQGSSYDTALLKVYGFDMDGLNTIWQNYLLSAVAAAAR